MNNNDTSTNEVISEENDVNPYRETMTDDELQAVYEKVLKDEADAIAEIQKDDPEYTPNAYDHDFAEFFMNNPFFGALTLEITKLFDTKQPTAYIGVRLNGKSHEVILGINPKFFRGITRKQRQGVLKHELYHLIFQHIFSRSMGDSNYALMWNWATDMAINSIIGKENLPSLCIIPGVRPMKPAEVLDANGKPVIDPKTRKPMTDPKRMVPVEGPYADFIEKAPLLQSSDYYFEELRKIQEQEGDKDNEIAISSGIGTMDDHGKWGDIPSEVQEQIRDKVREMIGKGAQRADRDNSWGDIPQEIQEQIRRMISREIDWRNIVKNFIGRCRSSQRNSTIRKINKKMPYINPGVKRPLIANFVAFIDQSGSMSDEDICLLFGELEGLSRETSVDVFHFDTEIDMNSKTVWKKGQPAPSAHRTRSGGTDFNAVAGFLNHPDNRGKYSGAIILTDGYAPVMGFVNGCKVLWVITEHGTLETVRPGDLACKMKQDKQFKNY